MSNLETIQKLTLGVEDTQEVIITYDDNDYPFTLRPLTSGELSTLKVLEKKTLKVKVGMKNGKRQKVESNFEDIDISAGEYQESQLKVIYKAVALSLSVDGEKVTVNDVKDMKQGVPELLFDKVVEVSRLTAQDLTLLQNFRQNK